MHTNVATTFRWVCVIGRCDSLVVTGSFVALKRSNGSYTEEYRLSYVVLVYEIKVSLVSRRLP